MKREIKFRGLRTDGKGWAYGNLINWHPTLKPRIVWFVQQGETSEELDFKETNYEVIPESVGQFTGLKDINGKECFEGDIFKSKYDRLGNLLVNPVLMYEDLRWVLIGDDRNFEYLDYYETETELEIIGNIHENPELLNN